ncbi:MAG: glycerophosphodiester phosphodiesterase [Calditrichaeota bacterium]|nr:MAG: glycerophosphodiester phosphodiesterase [Calditrichota bacterium]
MKKHDKDDPFIAPIICAHRGASGYAPENTMAAFQMAIDLQTDMIEFDVQQTRDKKLYIMHDEKVRRTTNGKKKLWQLTGKELEKLDAGSWFAKKFTGERVPEFDSVLKLAKGKVKLNIEVKCNGKQDNMLEQVIEKIQATGFEKDCVLTSFDFFVIDQIKSLAPELEVGYVFSKQGLRAKSFKAPVDVLSVHFTLITRKFMRKARKAGKKVFVWTVNNKWLMHRMCKMGVDGIITDYPDRLATVIKIHTERFSVSPGQRK